MFSNTIKEWQAYISELDEFYGEEPRYPITAIQQHISSEFRSQNEILLHSSKYLSESITNGIEDSTYAICGTLEKGFNSLINVNQKGFDTLSYDLQNIDATLNEMSNVISWGFDRTVDQIKTSNLLLTNISLLLQIPPSQKERQEYIKEGLKFYQNSRFNKSLYDDALENLLEAEKIKKTDYFILQKIGIIYLYSTEHLDVEKALDYFLRASKYSYIETLDSAVKSNNLLNYDISEDLKNRVRDVLDIKKQTADSFIYAGRCYYILKDYKKALEYATKAYDLLPSNLNAGFEKAKYLSKLEETDKALELLDKLIDSNKFIARKTTSDFDLISKPEIENYLKTIAEQKRIDLANLIKGLKKKTSNSKLDKQIERMNSLYNSNDYISTRIALEELKQSFDYDVELIELKDSATQRYQINKGKVHTTMQNCYKYLIDLNDKLPVLRDYILLDNKLQEEQSAINIEIYKLETVINNLSSIEDVKKYGLYTLGLIIGAFLMYLLIGITHPGLRLFPALFTFALIGASIIVAYMFLSTLLSYTFRAQPLEQKVNQLKIELDNNSKQQFEERRPYITKIKGFKLNEIIKTVANKKYT